MKMAIRNNPFVELRNDSKDIFLKNREVIDIVEFYRAVIYNGCPVELLTSDFYQKNINETLLSRISEIQFGFEIPRAIACSLSSKIFAISNALCINS